MNLKTLKALNQSLAIKFISVLLSYPKSIILLPVLIIFILSYNITYDFSIKKLNSYFADQYTRLPFEAKDDIPIRNFHLSDNSELTKVVLSRMPTSVTSTSTSSNSSIWDTDNVLNFEFFSQLYNLQLNLSSQNVTVISPLSDFPLNKIDFNEINLTTELNPTNFQPYLIRYLNYDLDHLLTFLYVDQIVKSNHLINYAKNIKLYVIHDKTLDVKGYLGTYLNQPEMSEQSIIQIDHIVSTTTNSSIKDFIRYYLVQKRLLLPTVMLFQISNFLIILSIITFTLYIYISLANEHKVRSSLGIITGWFIGVVISCSSSINLITNIHGYKSWRVIFEPLSAFTKCSFIFSALLISARYLFMIVRYLSNERNSEKNLYRKLYNLYAGYYGFPKITQYLLYDIFALIFTHTIGMHILNYYMEGDLKIYVDSRLLRVAEAHFVTFIIQYFLNMTFIVGIALVDRKRFDITDFLDQKKESSISNGSFSSGRRGSVSNGIFSSNENNGVNVFSYFLLKLNSQEKPSRSSLRYRIGQAILKIGFPADFSCCSIMLGALNLVLLMSSFLHWTILIPYDLVNNKKDIINLGGINILKNTNNFIYYLELFLIVIVIIASSLFTFNLTKFDGDFTTHNNKAKSTRKILTASDFEVEVKQFNAIDLSHAGHNLDILKIATNSKCSFTVTIGLDHKILIWSPLSTPLQDPVNIASTVMVNGEEKEFWPINHVNISDDGNYIVLINLKYSLIKCFERKSLSFKWVIPFGDELTELVSNRKFKILESFFRRRTIARFLARKILQKQKHDKKRSKEKKERVPGTLKNISMESNESDTHNIVNTNIRPSTPNIAKELSVESNHSDAPNIVSESIPAKPKTSKTGKSSKTHKSSKSSSSTFSNFPQSSAASSNNNYNKPEVEDSSIQDDFAIVLESGHLVVISCADGAMKAFNILENDKQSHLISTEKVSTPRISDRIVCQTSNHDLIVATVINNNWKFRTLTVREGFYNQEQLIYPTGLSRSSSYVGDIDFKSIYNGRTILEEDEDNDRFKNLQVNKSILVGVHFVGMIIRVIGFTAELIDIQRGIVLKTFNVGHFKPSSFKVSHSESTHCKFCGCASIQSFSIIYEDFYSPTLIIQTYKIENMRSKTSICLRVERDPREIRCLGFNAVTERQHWYHDVDGWEITDVNMIIGIKKKSSIDDDSHYSDEQMEEIVENKPTYASLVQNGGLLSLRNRTKATFEDEKVTVSKIWDGFIVTVLDGKIIQYKIPKNDFSERAIINNKINCVKKYGFKSIILSTLNLMEIIYLGNEKLIEQDIYFSGTNAVIGSILEDDQEESNQDNNQPVNSELMFISKRRKMRDRLKKE